MTTDGRPLAVLFSLQFAAAIVCRLGGIVGRGVMRKLHEGAELPPLTQFCLSLGFWPLLVPLVWVVLAFARAQREAPYWEILLWSGLAVASFLVMGGGGVLAAIMPLFVIVSGA